MNLQLVIALRLSRYFGTTPQHWLNLQREYDLSATIAQHGEQFDKTVQPKIA